MGDIHAKSPMGDCELCGTGLEIGRVITVPRERAEGPQAIGPLSKRPMPGMS